MRPLVDRIGQLKAYLEAGDCYQGNLTIRGRGHCDATPEAAAMASPD